MDPSDAELGLRERLSRRDRPGFRRLRAAVLAGVAVAVAVGICGPLLLAVAARRFRAEADAGGVVNKEVEAVCSASWSENCHRTRCCSESGFYCFQKDPLFAACRPFKACTPGMVNLQEPPKFQTPWDCVALSLVDFPLTDISNTANQGRPKPPAPPPRRREPPPPRPLPKKKPRRFVEPPPWVLAVPRTTASTSTSTTSTSTTMTSTSTSTTPYAEAYPGEEAAVDAMVDKLTKQVVQKIYHRQSEAKARGAKYAPVQHEPPQPTLASRVKGTWMGYVLAACSFFTLLAALLVSISLYVH